MKTATALTVWAGNGGVEMVNANHPAITDDYNIKKYEDITGQPSENLQPAPNVHVVIIECTKAVLDSIEADVNYEVLTSGEIK